MRSNENETERKNFYHCSHKEAVLQKAEKKIVIQGGICGSTSPSCFRLLLPSNPISIFNSLVGILTILAARTPLKTQSTFYNRRTAKLSFFPIQNHILTSFLAYSWRQKTFKNPTKKLLLLFDKKMRNSKTEKHKKRKIKIMPRKGRKMYEKSLFSSPSEESSSRDQSAKDGKRRSALAWESPCLGLDLHNWVARFQWRNITPIPIFHALAARCYSAFPLRTLLRLISTFHFVSGSSSSPPCVALY